MLTGLIGLQIGQLVGAGRRETRQQRDHRGRRKATDSMRFSHRYPPPDSTTKSGVDFAPGVARKLSIVGRKLDGDRF